MSLFNWKVGWYWGEFLEMIQPLFATGINTPSRKCFRARDGALIRSAPRQTSTSSNAPHSTAIPAVVRQMPTRRETSDGAGVSKATHHEPVVMATLIDTRARPGGAWRALRLRGSGTRI